MTQVNGGAIIDPREILTTAAIIIAIKSISDTPNGLVDIGGWLADRNLIFFDGMGDLSVTFSGKSPTSYFEGRKRVFFDAISPRLRELTICDRLRELEVADLIICVAILTRLIRKVAGSTENRFSVTGIDSLIEFVIRRGRKCIPTLDQVTRALAPSLARADATSGIRIARAMKGRWETARPRALDPELRVKCDVLRHVPRGKLIERLKGPSTPMESLSDQISGRPCATRRQSLDEHALLDGAIRELWIDFRLRPRAGPIWLFDSYDLAR